MDVFRVPTDNIEKLNKVALSPEKDQRPFRTTPFIITFSESIVSEFDIHSIIKLGLRVVRFKMTNITKSDKVMLLDLLDRALKWCCEKYGVSSWPVALSIDVPNAIIKTGFLENPAEKHMTLEEGTYLTLTSDPKYLTKCTETRIFMDDPFTLPTLKVGTEITIDFGEIVMKVTELIDSKNIICHVEQGGNIKDQDFICIRGAKHFKPALNKNDLEIIDFAKEYKFDIITINLVRNPTTPRQVRGLFKKHRPLLISTICEQEGLDNIDEIIKESDAIILAREFLAHEIADKFKMISIQLYVSGKCKKYGKPFYLSGNILESVCDSDRLSGCDLNDITNAVMEEAGFSMRKYKDPAHLIKGMQILNNICKTVEPLADRHQIWRKSYEYKIPVNAAEAAILATILMAQQTKAMVVIVPTVTGSTVKQVVHMSQDLFIIAITSHPLVAKQLQLYRGVISIIYDKKYSKNWNLDMDTRVKFAVDYGIKFEVLTRNANYVVLRKSSPTSSYSDHVSAWTVYSEDDLIRLEINELIGKNRSDGEIKLAWKQMKLAAKTKLSSHRQYQMQTGGGEKPKSPSQENLAIMAIAPHDFVL